MRNKLSQRQNEEFKKRIGKHSFSLLHIHNCLLRSIWMSMKTSLFLPKNIAVLFEIYTYAWGFRLFVFPFNCLAYCFLLQAPSRPFSSVPFLELFSGPDHRSYLDNMTHNCFCCSFSASLPRSLSYITMMVYLQTFFNMTCPKRTDFFASVTFMWEMHYDPIATHRPMWVPQKMNWESMDINRTLAMKLWVKQPQLWTPTFVSIQVVFLISFC